MLNKRIINIIVWGTGCWSREFINLLPDNVNIEVFVETNPTKNSFQGISVVSKNEYRYFYARTDFTVVAVEKSEEIKEYLGNIGLDKNIYYLYGNHGRPEYAKSIHSEYMMPIRELFYEKYVYYRNEENCADYVITKCGKGNINIITNKRYDMMVKELSDGRCYQEDDIEYFIELAQQYYGINPSTTGIFLDVGANIGTSSLYAKKVLIPNARIYAFEPVKENCKQIYINFILNDINKEEYTIFNVALSDKNGYIDCMLSNEGNMGDNRICINGNGIEGRNIEKCESRRLHSILTDEEISEISYIWMDVQAHEYFVLEGMRDILINQNIPLYMEFWPEQLRANKSLTSLIELLETVYKRYIIIDESENGVVHEISELYEFSETLKNGSSRDLFFIK